MVLPKTRDSEQRSMAVAELSSATTASEMAARLTDMRNRLSVVKRFFHDVMEQDVDYGVIPGTQKPTLLKPGAEKLCEFYGYAIQVETEREDKDRETGFYDCSVKVRLASRRTGELVAEGVGEANTMESRYRYRWVFERDLSEGTDKGQLKTKRVRTKKGWATMYRVENDDPWSLWNTIKKMAKKRGIVDAALSATRSSGLFTQDLEDLQAWAAAGDVVDGEVVEEAPEEPEPKPKKSNGNGAIRKRMEELAVRAELLGVDREQLGNVFRQITDGKYTKENIDAVEEWLDEYEARLKQEAADAPKPTDHVPTDEEVEAANAALQQNLV